MKSLKRRIFGLVLTSVLILSILISSGLFEIPGAHAIGSSVWSGPTSGPPPYSFNLPMDIATLPGYYFVADYVNWRVQGFRSSDHQLMWSFSERQPLGIAAYGGVVYVTSPEFVEIVALDAITGELLFSFSLSYQPTDIAADENYVYVTDSVNAQVKIYYPNMALYSTLNTFAGPTGIDVDFSGNIYVTFSGLNKVYEYF